MEAYRRLTSGLSRPTAHFARADPIRELGFVEEVEALRDFLFEWISRADAEIRPFLKWQFDAGSKYFRPLTVFSAYVASHDRRPTADVIARAGVVEMLHNMALIVDDILDHSESRRGKPTLHTRFGELPGLMTAGIVTAEAFDLVRDQPYVIERLSELVRRLGIAECLQWRLRRQPAGLEDWRRIAREDTGTMFEICACIGSGDDRLRRFGQLLGILYHGADDVSDVLGSVALGGGGDEDLRDGILTLPMSIAIHDPAIAAAFRRGSPEDVSKLASAVRAVLPAAAAELDRIAAEAADEAMQSTPYPALLNRLIQHTRALAGR